MVEPGQTTGDIDAYAEKRIREMGATPSFKGYHGFPASICASINNEVVHGIPSPKRVIRQGDLLKVDTGASTFSRSPWRITRFGLGMPCTTSLLILAQMLAGKP